MFKLLVAVIAFCKQLIFDSKDEYRYTSYRFNTRKFIVFILIIFSLTLNVLLTDKIIYLANKLHEKDLSIKENEKNL